MWLFYDSEKNSRGSFMFKGLIFILLIGAELYASMWGKGDAKRHKENIQKIFKDNVVDANSIIRKGDYEKLVEYKREIAELEKELEKVEIEQEQRRELKADIAEYAALVEQIALHFQNKAPGLHETYNTSLSKLDFFNKKIASIGLWQLLNDWQELSRIKNRFVKEPHQSLEKDFDEKLVAITTTITELYLDEEVEGPLLAYLENYKQYFKELKRVYSSVGYANIHRFKPLSYKIKTQLNLHVSDSM